jgi:hypothetical protein
MPSGILSYLLITDVTHIRSTVPLGCTFKLRLNE